jgi:Family of unknown function (DUF6152)
MKTIILTVGLALLVMPAAALAHHSFAAEFDAAKPITLSGTLVRVAWTNPHAHLHVDVTEAGKVTSWDFELGSPNALMRRGWSAHSLKPGETITVNGYRAKDGTSMANARSITTADGRKMFAGSSIDTDSTP